MNRFSTLHAAVALILTLGALSAPHAADARDRTHERSRSATHERGADGAILHPSPASPLANKGWAEKAEAQLRAMGVPVP